MKGFMIEKGYMRGFMNVINPFQGFIILRTFFTVKSFVEFHGSLPLSDYLV